MSQTNKQFSVAETPPKLNPKWVKRFARQWRAFLRDTDFPEPARNGERGSRFAYPESLIMLIAVLAVKCKIRSYLGIHRLAVTYWTHLTPTPALPPMSDASISPKLVFSRAPPRACRA